MYYERLKKYKTKCPVCGEEKYTPVRATSPDGYVSLDHNIGVCNKCGTVYSLIITRVECPVDGRYIPREPVDKRYAPCDFTTYAKCPNCGERVENCMGHYDERCRKCGQRLKWE